MIYFVKFRKFIIPVVVLVLITACGNPLPISTPLPPTTRPTIHPTEPPTQPCEGMTGNQGPSYTLVRIGTKAELLWKVEFVPWWVRSSPDGRILAVTDGGDSIFELKPDGGLAVAFRCPGISIETVVAASDGAIWFSARDGGRLYRVPRDGKVSIMAQSGNRNLEAGLNGSVFAMENGLSRIDPDGTITKITDNISGRKFAVGPKGEIVALDNGNIVRISDSGETTKVASGYGPEQWLAFGPDGLLYVTHWSGVDVVDLGTGRVSSIEWLKNSYIGESGTFTPDGRLLLYHPNTNVFAIDLKTQTVSVIHQVLSNSWAMAVNPGDAVYIAFGTKLPNGQTTIYRVIDQKTLEPIASVPYGIERSMTFDAQGMGYLGVGDVNKGGNVFKFDPASGKVEDYYKPKCFPGSLTLDPQTDQVWWEECNRFVSLNDKGDQTSIEGVPNGQQASLAITPAGELFNITFFKGDSSNTPVKHHLYRWDEADSSWNQVADLTQSDPNITLSTLTACPDGRIYTIESLDGQQLHLYRSSFNAVRRLEPDGTLTLLGYDFAFDGLAANCDPKTNRIIFTSGAGIFALTP